VDSTPGRINSENSTWICGTTRIGYNVAGTSKYLAASRSRRTSQPAGIPRQFHSGVKSGKSGEGADAGSPASKKERTAVPFRRLAPPSPRNTGTAKAETIRPEAPGATERKPIVGTLLNQAARSIHMHLSERRGEANQRRRGRDGTHPDDPCYGALANQRPSTWAGRSGTVFEPGGMGKEEGDGRPRHSTRPL
jgi:hypothetical protein